MTAHSLSEQGNPFYLCNFCDADGIEDMAQVCATCRVEMCAYLDAYYGKDPAPGYHCGRCRPRYLKSASVVEPVELPF